MHDQPLGAGGEGCGGRLEREEEPTVQNRTAVLILSRVHQNHSEGDSAGSGVSCCENISIDDAGWVGVEIEKIIML